MVFGFGHNTDYEAGERRVIFAEIEHRVENGIEAREKRVVLGHHRFELVVHLVLHVDEYRHEQLNLAREVVVDRRRRDACCLRNLAVGRVVVTAGGERLACRVE